MTAFQRYVLPLDDPADAEVRAAELWAAGALGVWEQPDELVAWFTDRHGGVPPGGSWREEPDRDWQEAWKAGIAPVDAGRVTVVPSWLVAQHRPRPAEVTLVLDPGRAFGSGHHATTTQCLELLQTIELTGASVLDVGCGTGVLAIAAARLGASRVTAVDVDPDAVEVTRDNAARNGVDVTARVGSVDVATGPADVVLANLVTDTVTALAERLVAAVRPDGALIASGIAAERERRAVGALEAAGLTIRERRVRDGWLAVLGTARPDERRFASDRGGRSP